MLLELYSWYFFSSLDQNNLTEVSNTWLFGLRSLEELSLRHNAIVRIAAGAWHTTTPSLLSLSVTPAIISLLN